jgi:hypothetical protein
MKTMKSFLIFFCLPFLSFYTAQSQIIVPGSEELLDKLRLNNSINSIEGKMYSDITGDPYLYKDFQQGKMVLKSGETYQLGLKFDIYANQMHMKYKDQVYAIIHPEKIASLVVGPEEFVYCDYIKSANEKSAETGAYFIQKIDGKCKLLVKKNVRIQEAEPPKILQEAKPAKFIRTNDSFYLKLENKPAVKINSKSDVLSTLNAHKDKMNEFLNSNKLGTKKLEDLIKIVSLYNSL